MKDLYILWMEDNKNWYHSIESLLVSVAKGKGVNLVLDQHPDGNNVDVVIKNLTLEVALIDHHMPGQAGDRIIARIRELGYSTQIIYYTQDPDIELAENVKGIAGIRCILREDVYNEVIRLIDKRARE